MFSTGAFLFPLSFPYPRFAEHFSFWICLCICNWSCFISYPNPWMISAFHLSVYLTLLWGSMMLKTRFEFFFCLAFHIFHYTWTQLLGFQMFEGVMRPCFLTLYFCVAIIHRLEWIYLLFYMGVFLWAAFSWGFSPHSCLGRRKHEVSVWKEPVGAQGLYSEACWVIGERNERRPGRRERPCSVAGASNIVKTLISPQSEYRVYKIPSRNPTDLFCL